MRTFTNMKRLSVVVFAMAMMTFAVGSVNAGTEYRFKVKNSTDSKIVKLMASPDGKKYGNFDIGKGIAPGATMELVWDESTDDSDCEWYFKASFADGSVSAAKKFDFCEKELVLEFAD